MPIATYLVSALCLLTACCPRSQPYVSPTDKPGNGPAEVVPDLPPTGACADAPLITLEEMARGVHAGDRVAFDGVPHVSVSCTDALCFGPDRGLCGPQRALCCNACGGGYRASFGHEFEVHLRGLSGCSGMDCGYHCEPFGTRPTHEYRFVGTNDFRPTKGKTATYDVSYFAVEKVCAKAVESRATTGRTTP